MGKKVKSDRIIVYLAITVIIFTLSSWVGISVLIIEKEPVPAWAETFNSSNRSESVTVYDPDRVDENFCIGLYTAPIHEQKYFLQKSKNLTKNETFEGYFCIANNMYSENDYLIFCLMDYKQVPFSFNESDAEILHKIRLESFEEKFYHFDLGPLESGTHEFEIFLILKPYETSLNQSFRLSTDFSHLGSIRLNLFVDDWNMPPVVYTNFSDLNCHQCDSQYPGNDGVMLVKEPCSTRAWTSENVTSGDPLDYWMNVAAADDYPVAFGLIVLVDYIQVPIWTNSPNDVIFGKLDAGEKLSFPTKIVVPREKGVHELMAIWLPAPYQRMDRLPEAPASPNQWAWAQPSIRVGLNVG